MVRIATRRSALARAQALQTGRLIAERTGSDFELVPMATTGDLHADRAVTTFDSKGLFVDAIRDAVLAGDCDLAVHSYKDLPVEPAPGLVIAAVPPREDPRDVLVTRLGEGDAASVTGGRGAGQGQASQGHTLSSIPETATVGTSSQRRRLQLLCARPSLQVLELRGNIDTRLRKVAEGELDAVVIALAGLKRLEAAGEDGAGLLKLLLVAVPLEVDECLPAPGQGALAIECRTDNEAALAACRAIDDEATRRAVRAERAYLEQLGGGCLAPVGAWGRVVDRQLELHGMLACPVTRQVLRRSLRGPLTAPEQLGAALAEDVRTRGGQPMLDLIEELRVGRVAKPPAAAPQASAAP